MVITRDFYTSLPFPFQWAAGFCYHGPNAPEEPHSHPGFQITLVTEGRFGIDFPPADRQILGPGECIVLSPELPHFWHSLEPKITRVLTHYCDTCLPEHFGRVRDFLGPGLRGHYWRARLPAAETKQLAVRLTQAGRNTGPAGAGLRYAYCLELFLKCAERVMSAYAAPEQVLPAPLIRAVLRIEKDFAGLLTLEALATEADLSISRFSALFQAHLGLAPMHYLRRHRLGRAGSLLRHTDWPVERIATQTGFNSLHYFSRAFKAEFGRSPRSYREQAHSGEVFLPKSPPGPPQKTPGRLRRLERSEG